MKIGSFFLILLAALVALGYLIAETFRLHEEMSRLQKENERLSLALQNVEKEKQDALIALQNAGMELQSCQQTVEQSNQVIARLTEENEYLKQQNLFLASQQRTEIPDAASRPQVQPVQAAAFGLAAFLILGFGSAAAIGLKSLQKHSRRIARPGNYVYLTDAEIEEVIRLRRKAAKPNGR